MRGPDTNDGMCGSIRVSYMLSILFLTAIFLYLSLFVLPSSARLMIGDQYINFDDARRMAAGQKLYRDIFQYTLPGTEILEVPLIRIFGAKLALTHALLIIVGTVEIWLALIIATAVLSGSNAVLASLLFLCFGFHRALDATHHEFSVMMAYAALAMIVRKRSFARLIGAGVLIGLATCFTQTQGLVALAVGGFLVWENQLKPPGERNLWRRALSLFAPFAVLVTLACVYVVWNAGWREFYRSIIEFPLLYYREGIGNNWGTSFEDWSPTARAIAQWLMIKLLVPGAYLAFFVYWWGKAMRSDAPPAVEPMLVAVAGAALYATVAYAPRHIWLASISLPAFILTIWLLSRSGSELWKWPAWAGAAAFVVLTPIYTQSQKYWFYDAPAGRLAISNYDLFSELTWLGEHTRPGDKFYSPAATMFYVLLDLQNPTRLPFIESDEYTRPEQVITAARMLHEASPRLVLWPFLEGDADDPADRLYPLGEELRAHYRPILSLRDGEVWELIRTKQVAPRTVP